MIGWLKRAVTPAPRRAPGASQGPATGAMRKLGPGYLLNIDVVLTADEVREVLRAAAPILPILDMTAAPAPRDDEEPVNRTEEEEEADRVRYLRERRVAYPGEPIGADLLARLRAAGRAGDGARLAAPDVRVLLRDVLPLLDLSAPVDNRDGGAAR